MNYPVRQIDKKIHEFCDRGDGKCHRVGGCTCGAFTQPVAQEEQQVLGDNPTLLTMLKELAVTDGHQALFVCELGKGKRTLQAKVEVRLIDTTDSAGHTRHWNVAAGNYEGEPQAGHG